ncbi:MAG: hypothetical protein JWM95_904 [Gemmatimonadetes bacterium]|nr:hypothetical protein [Gemmatimonadota bacterium]
MKSTRTIILAIALATISCDSTSPLPAGIGTTGGTATSANNAAKVLIPAGALAAGTTVTVAPAPTAPAVPGLVATSAFEFGPAGTTFTVPVVISITYDPALLPANVPESSLQMYTATGNTWVVVPGSSVNVSTHTVSGSTRHFSTYAPIGTVAVAQVTLTPGSQSLTLGTSAQLSAQVLDGSGGALSGRLVTWSSSDPAKVSVSSTGLATGVSLGSAVITATSEGKSASSTVTVTPVPAASVVLSPATITVTVGATATFAASVRDAAGNALPGRAVVWSVSDATKASITADGLVTGIAAGTVTISASAEGKTGSATLVIAQMPVALVALSAPSAIRVGESAPTIAILTSANGTVLENRPISWSSSSPAVARVSVSGLITGVAEGTATISATSEGKVGTTTVTVSNPVDAISISPTSATVAIGATTSLVARVVDNTGALLMDRTVTWSSSDPAKAVVSQSGTVTGVGAGTVTITAAAEGRSATAAITVGVPAPPAAVSTVTLSPLTVSVPVGTTTTLTPVLKDALGNTLAGRVVTWSSTDPTRATVNSSGVVTGVAPGLVAILATSEGKTGNAAVTVVAAPVSSVTLTPPTSTIYVGYAGQITATLKDASNNTLGGRTIAWASSDPAKAVVNGTGGVTGIAAGAVTITATSEGVSGTANVTIVPSPVVTVVFSSAVTNIAVGSMATLSARTSDLNGVTLTGRVVTWTSSDPSKATVSAAGVVTGVAVGSTTITATSEGISGTATVNVSAATAAASVPVQLTAIATGDFHSCGLNASGAAYCWGLANLGDGTQHDALTPVAVSGGHIFASVGVSTTLSCGITTGSDLYCWGGGAQLFSLPASVPTLVEVGITWANISVNTSHTCGVATDGTGYCVGANTGGRLGTGQSQAALAASSTFLPVAGGLHWKQIITGGNASCGVSTAGAVYCWGSLTQFMNGPGAVASSASPVLLSSAVNFASLTPQLNGLLCGLSTAGDTYCFGITRGFSLGGTPAATLETPVHVGGTLQFKSIATLNSSLCGISTANALYCWGSNGQFLGQGPTYPPNSAIPLVVMSGTSFSAVAGGPTGSACAIATSGVGYCWGENFNGELGDGTHANRTSLTPILGGITFRVP